MRVEKKITVDGRYPGAYELNVQPKMPIVRICPTSSNLRENPAIIQKFESGL